MRRIALFVGAVVTVAMVVGLGLTRLTQSAYARETCNIHSLNGPYGYAFTGSRFTPPGSENEVADAAVGGRVVFNGDGQFAGRDWVSVNGHGIARAYKGAYSFGSDCTGVLTITEINGAPASRTSAFTLVDNGRQIKTIQTDPGFVLAGTFTRAKQDCTNETLHSSYGYASQGQRFAPPFTESSEVGDFAAGGRASFNGDGTGEGTDTVSANGRIVSPSTYTTTYQLERDCTGTLTLTRTAPTPHPPPGHFRMVVVDDGRMIEMVVTDPGAVVAVELVRQ